MAYLLSKPIIFQQAKCNMYWTQTCSLKRPFNVKKIAIYTITKLMSRAANNNNNQTRWKAEIKIVKKPVNPSVHCWPIWHNNMLIKGGLISKGISPFGLIFKKNVQNQIPQWEVKKFRMGPNVKYLLSHLYEFHSKIFHSLQ